MGQANSVYLKLQVKEKARTKFFFLLFLFKGQGCTSKLKKDFSYKALKSSFSWTKAESFSSGLILLKVLREMDSFRIFILRSIGITYLLKWLKYSSMSL